MKSFLDLVKSRQSDRAYDINRAVEAEKLDYILEAARLAPSACNAQPWKFIVVTDPLLRQETAGTIADKALGINHYVFQAPVLIVVLEEAANFTSNLGSTIKRKHFPHMDLGVVVAHITLAAADLGLGSCIMGWFNEKKMRSVLDIPSSKRPVLVIAMGYSTQVHREKKRKKTKDIVQFNKYR